LARKWMVKNIIGREIDTGPCFAILRRVGDGALTQMGVHPGAKLFFSGSAVVGESAGLAPHISVQGTGAGNGLGARAPIIPNLNLVQRRSIVCWNQPAECRDPIH